MSSRFRPVPAWLLAPCLFAIAGCRESVRVYDVAKAPVETPPTATAHTHAQHAPTGASGAPAPSAAGLHWHPPAGWRAEPASGFRRGSFKLGPAETQADLSITAFPGEAGGLRENINRWRGQLALEPLAANENPGTVLDGAALPMLLVDLRSGPAAILGGVVAHAGETWFFKLAGPADTVTSARAEFIAFLQTVHPASQHDHAAAARSRPAPATAPEVTPSLASSSPPRTAAPRVVPDHWEEKPISGMRISSFSIRGPDDTEADLSVIPLEGDGGGLMSNLNRWRGQLGLPAWPEARLPEITTPVTLPGGDGVLVDFSSEEGLLRDGARARILGVITQRGAQTWFFKMTGHESLVGGEREALLAFARRFPLPSANPAPAAHTAH